MARPEAIFKYCRRGERPYNFVFTSAIGRGLARAWFWLPFALTCLFLLVPEPSRATLINESDFKVLFSRLVLTNLPVQSNAMRSNVPPGVSLSQLAAREAITAVCFSVISVLLL